MPKAKIVAISGSASPRSRTRVVLEDVVQSVAERVDAMVDVIDIGEIVDLLGPAKVRAEAPAEIERLLTLVEQSDLILAASPVYKGSYTGLFKHFIDMIEYQALTDRPVGLIATGGSDRRGPASGRPRHRPAGQGAARPARGRGGCSARPDPRPRERLTNQTTKPRQRGGPYGQFNAAQDR